MFLGCITTLYNIGQQRQQDSADPSVAFHCIKEHILNPTLPAPRRVEQQLRPSRQSLTKVEFFGTLPYFTRQYIHFIEGEEVERRHTREYGSFELSLSLSSHQAMPVPPPTSPYLQALERASKGSAAGYGNNRSSRQAIALAGEDGDNDGEGDVCWV